MFLSRMSVMKQAVLLLLLLAALCTDAAPTPEECSSLNKRLLTKDLHTVSLTLLTADPPHS